jgi:hypothetical protein
MPLIHRAERKTTPLNQSGSNLAVESEAGLEPVVHRKAFRALPPVADAAPTVSAL